MESVGGVCHTKLPSFCTRKDSIPLENICYKGIKLKKHSFSGGIKTMDITDS